MACECCLEACSVDLEWVNISQLTVVVSGPKFADFFLFNTEEIIVVNAVYRLSTPSVVLEIFVLKVHARTNERANTPKT